MDRDPGPAPLPARRRRTAEAARGAGKSSIGYERDLLAQPFAINEAGGGGGGSPGSAARTFIADDDHLPRGSGRPPERRSSSQSNTRAGPETSGAASCLPPSRSRLGHADCPSGRRHRRPCESGLVVGLAHPGLPGTRCRHGLGEGLTSHGLGSRRASIRRRLLCRHAAPLRRTSLAT